MHGHKDSFEAQAYAKAVAVYRLSSSVDEGVFMMSCQVHVKNRRCVLLMICTACLSEVIEVLHKHGTTWLCTTNHFELLIHLAVVTIVTYQGYDARSTSSIIFKVKKPP